MSTYSVTMQNQTIIANSEMVIIHTDSTLGTLGSNIRILRAWCGQGSTETSDQLGIQLAIQASAFGTYTSTAPIPHLAGAAVALAGGTAGAEGTCGTDSSANAAGTKTPIVYDGFNNVNGWLWVPTPEERIVLPADTAIVLAIVGTPATLTNWSAGITFETL